MALISVVELMFDPDFIDPATVLRNVESVGDDGIARRSVVPIAIMASIQANSEDLIIDGAASRTSGSYECITAFPLNEATETTAADIVVWQGMQFTVISVAKFGNFSAGQGHYEAVMELKPVRTNQTRAWTSWDGGQTVWDGGATLWDVPGAPAPTTPWDGSATSWQDETTTAVWDVNT